MAHHHLSQLTVISLSFTFSLHQIKLSVRIRTPTHRKGWWLITGCRFQKQEAYVVDDANFMRATEVGVLLIIFVSLANHVLNPHLFVLHFTGMVKIGVVWVPRVASDSRVRNSIWIR